MKKVIFFLLFVMSPACMAADLYRLTLQRTPVYKYYSSPKAACADWYQYLITQPYPTYDPHYGTSQEGTCWIETVNVAGDWWCQVITAGRWRCGDDWLRVLRLVDNPCVGKQVWDVNAQRCVTRNGPEEGRQQCSKKKTDKKEPKKMAGNPITISFGNKFEFEVDYRSDGQFPLTVSRSFNSSIGSWRFFPEVRVITAGSEVDVIRSDGKGINFRKEGEVWASSPDVSGTLTSTEDSQGSIDGWTYTTANDKTEIYNSQGRIISVTNPNGLSHSYTYAHNYLLESVTVTHSNGGALVYQLDSEGRISGFTDPDNKTYQYSYDDAGNLSTVIYPDETPADNTDNPRRQYHYEDPNFPHALTGITDENGVRYATWTYDAQGRAISSEHAGGIDKTTLDYTYLEDAADPRVTVTNPLGKQTTYHLTTIHGVRKVTQVEGHPTASCAGANKAYQYDANGNVISKTDWNGVTTTYTYDLDRNLELSRTEAVGTPEERTITTEWHPQYRLPTKVTEPNKITEYSYSPQGQLLNRHEQTIQ